MEEHRGARLITIVGTPRNGASVLAGALHELGADLGVEPPSLPSAADDPGALFEHLPVLNLNRDLLIALGGTWSTPPALPPGWVDDERISYLRLRADLVASQTPERMIVKDSRLSLVQPLWEDVGSVCATILCLRNPIAVAELLSAQYSLTVSQSLFLWFRYNASAFLVRPDALVVEYESLLENSVIELTRIADHIDLDVDSGLIEAAARTMPPLTHDRGETDPRDTPIEVMCKRLHDLMRSGERLDSDETVWLWARLATELPWAGPGDPDIRRARREVVELSTQVLRLTRDERRTSRRLRRLEADLQQALRAADDATLNQTMDLLAALEISRP